MVYSRYTKQRVLQLYLYENCRPPQNTDLLKKEGLSTSRQGVLKFLKRYNLRQTIARQPGSGRPYLVTAEVKRIFEEQMRLDDETTAYQLHPLLQQKGFNLSLKTILRCRSSLGWTLIGSAYCQLIREANKVFKFLLLCETNRRSNKHLFPLLFSVCHNFFGNFQITRLCYQKIWQQKIQTKCKQ